MTYVQDPVSGAWIPKAEPVPVAAQKPQGSPRTPAMSAAAVVAPSPKKLGPLARVGLLLTGLAAAAWAVASVETKAAERAARAAATMDRAQRRLRGATKDESEDDADAPGWAPLGDAKPAPKRRRRAKAKAQSEEAADASPDPASDGDASADAPAELATE